MANYSINTIEIRGPFVELASFAMANPSMALGPSNDVHDLEWSVENERSVLSYKGATRRQPPFADCLSISRKMPSCLVSIHCVDEGVCYGTFGVWRGGTEILDGSCDSLVMKSALCSDVEWTDALEMIIASQRLGISLAPALTDIPVAPPPHPFDLAFLSSLLADDPAAAVPLSKKAPCISLADAASWASFMDAPLCRKAFFARPETISLVPLAPKTTEIGPCPFGRAAFDALCSSDPDSAGPVCELILESLDTRLAAGRHPALDLLSGAIASKGAVCDAIFSSGLARSLFLKLAAKPRRLRFDGHFDILSSIAQRAAETGLHDTPGRWLLEMVRTLPMTDGETAGSNGTLGSFLSTVAACHRHIDPDSRRLLISSGILSGEALSALVDDEMSESTKSAARLDCNGRKNFL